MIKRLIDPVLLLRALGFVVGFRALSFGLTFAFDTNDARRTVLYESITSLPLFSTAQFGIFLSVVGFVMMCGYIMQSKRASTLLVKYSAYVLFLVYLFVAVLYLVAGFHGYFLTIALPWLPLVYLTSYPYALLQNRRWVAKRRAEYGL